MIRVQPATARRRAFARWATAQTPKIRTVGLYLFAVPADLFVQAPEDILVGALVDGHRYVSPAEDETDGTPPPGAELLGVATADAFTAAGTVVRPGLVGAAEGDSSDRSDPGPDFAPLEDAPTDDVPLLVGDGPPIPAEDGTVALWVCKLCPREFTTERGRDTHRRQAHREARDAD
ncbi:hypothetical protein B0E38_01828 [Streptomyces sp. 111WW2]|uniref:hypothetical protein n=1 Tax=Streptomyces sp. 111WW2 TaxID=1945515 RepID=UPI000D2D8206|nr:hypothetical protein [Streptomyces sp. 111WW2]PSK57983.1 hypothetical protein B0E38_01828 [Streptomyces sp. 111WW2]